MAKKASKQDQASITEHDAIDMREAYLRVEAEADALPKEKLVYLNVDIQSATATVLGCIEKLKPFRERIVKALPEFELGYFDNLETYARAAAYANAHLAATSVADEPIQEISDELVKLREILVADATALAKRKRLDPRRLEELRGAVGYKNIAFDAILLTSLLRDHWSEISGKCDVDTADLERAELLASRLHTAVGVREQAPQVASEAADKRQRAFSLFANAYDEVRCAISYFRWHEGDLEKIAPSIYGGRKVSKKSDEEAPTVGMGTGNPMGMPELPAGASALIGSKPIASPNRNGSVVANPMAGLPGDEPFHR